MKAFRENVDLKNYVSNGEWELLEVNTNIAIIGIIVIVVIAVIVITVVVVLVILILIIKTQTWQ